MMNNTRFMAYVRTHIMEYLPEEYKEAIITLAPVKKLHEEYIGLTVRREEQTTAPIVKLDSFFNRYQEGETLESLLLEIAELIQIQPPEMMDPEIMEHYDKVAPLLFIRVSSTDHAESIMESSPHQVIGDLLITYHIYVSRDDDGWMSARVTHEMLDTLGVSEERLKEDAYSNTLKLFTLKMSSLSEAVTGIQEENPKTMVVSNEDMVYGANMLLAPGVMKEVASRIGGDFFAIPSSIHEFIAIVDDGEARLEDLVRMLDEANHTVVRPDEILSYKIYHYDADADDFKLAS